MYNGVGLLSVRGSGTSGYVQTNKFNMRRAPPVRSNQSDKPDKGRLDRQPNSEILEHNKKRALELKLAVYAESLEEQG
jgi:serine/arginine repetitive matrix protein 2